MRPPPLNLPCAYTLRALRAEQRSFVSWSNSLMATLTQHFHHSNSLLVLSNPTTLKKTQKSPPLQLSDFYQKNLKILSFKDICKHGNLKEAFFSFSNLFIDPNPPHFWPDEAYSSVLELCASKKALPQGQQIHAHVIKSDANYDSAFLSTKLVFMYGQCGSFAIAKSVFDTITHKTIFTWNAMIGAYVTNGEPLGALELYQEMGLSGHIVDAYTFPSIIKSCALLKDLSIGAQIHGMAIKYGYSSMVFVVNALVTMYSKCNDLNAALKLFDKMTEKEDVVSWNSIILACATNGQSMEALELFREIQKFDLKINTYTFVAALQGCEEPSLMKLGMEIHAAILKSSHFLDVYVANALLVMYARCNRMREAAKIFDMMDGKDNVSWNSMLSGFVQNRLFEEALQFFYNMLDSGQKPDQVSIISILATSGQLGNLLNGMEIHAQAIKNGLNSDLQVGNSLVDMYAKCCCTDYMDRVFSNMLDKDFISWTTIIAGNAQNNFQLKALDLFRAAQIEGVEVDAMMIGSALLACSGLKTMSHVKEIHGYMLRRGSYDTVLKNTIVDVYGECGNTEYAFRMFELIEPKDIVSWTSMISCYDHNGLANEAINLFYLMCKTGIETDSIALVSILSAAASLSALKKGKEVHGFLIRKGFILEKSLAGALVDMYSRCGSIENSYKVFNFIKEKDLISWTSMINAFGMHGRGKEAIELYESMKNSDFLPDHVTFLALLYACSHSGLIDEGKRFLEIMKLEHQLDPWPEHYACLVDLLGRGNHLKEAIEFVTTMGNEPNAAIWCALLGACRVHANKEIGEIAARKLLELDSENPGNYILVSNFFSSLEKWKDAEEVRTKMKGKGLKKNPACSWIEVGCKIHSFIARDKSHPQTDEIYLKLNQVIEKLKRERNYVADTKYVLHNIGEKEKVEMLYGHSERLALAFGLIKTSEGTTIRITKNLRVCGDCHTFCKLVSKIFEREIVVRDANRFHHFEDGVCSCKDFW